MNIEKEKKYILNHSEVVKYILCNNSIYIMIVYIYINIYKYKYIYIYIYISYSFLLTALD